MRDNNVAKSGLHKSVETFLYTIFLRVQMVFHLRSIKLAMIAYTSLIY